MKKLLLSIIGLAAGLPLAAQTAYMECGFSEGIPKEFTLHDEDGLEPSIDMKALGFEPGIPWLAMTESDGNTAAVSTSWYRKAGTSDDWMVTPSISVESDKTILRWRAKAGDKDYRDGYAVYVSESASSPTDFRKADPIFTTKQEKAEWTLHEVSLKEYAGKKVRVAFVNNTRDRATLWIDDIFIGIPAMLNIQSDMARVVNEDGPMRVVGTVTNISDTDVDGFTISYTFGDDETYRMEFDKKVRAGASAPFDFLSATEIERNQTLPYTLTVSAGNDKSSVTGVTTCLYRRIVAEEVTGVWCGYCVRGIVAMREMKGRYPDTFLGIAVHGSAPTWEDPMDFTDYTDYLFSSLGMSGYPHATVNRRKAQTDDPSSIPDYYQQLLERDLTAGLQLSISSHDASTRRLDLHTDVYFLDDMEECAYSLAYAVIENDVHKDAIIGDDGKPMGMNGYEQYNYYANNSMGEMGGFESLPQIVPGPMMTYQDVARGFWGDGFEGLEGSLPASVLADTPYGHDYTIELPDNILDDRNTEIVALLINGKTGEIINADVVPLFSKTDAVSAPVSETGVRIVREGSALRISSDGEISGVTMFDLGGRMLSDVSPASSETAIPTDGLKGVYLIRVALGNGIVTKKISL